MKFNKDNISQYTILEGNELKPCIMCKAPTMFIYYCAEAGMCSSECYDKFAKLVAEHERLDFEEEEINE